MLNGCGITAHMVVTHQPYEHMSKQNFRNPPSFLSFHPLPFLSSLPFQHRWPPPNHTSTRFGNASCRPATVYTASIVLPSRQSSSTSPSQPSTPSFEPLLSLPAAYSWIDLARRRHPHCHMFFGLMWHCHMRRRHWCLRLWSANEPFNAL